MGHGDEHVGQTRRDANVPKHRSGAGRQHVRGGFAEREVDDAMPLGVEAFEDLVADGPRYHVDDEVRLAVVETRGVAKVEGGGGRPRFDVVEMNVQACLVKGASDERANQPTAQTVNPHGWSLGQHASKVPALRLAP